MGYEISVTNMGAALAERSLAGCTIRQIRSSITGKSKTEANQETVKSVNYGGPIIIPKIDFKHTEHQ